MKLGSYCTVWNRPPLEKSPGIEPAKNNLSIIRSMDRPFGREKWRIPASDERSNIRNWMSPPWGDPAKPLAWLHDVAAQRHMKRTQWCWPEQAPPEAGPALHPSVYCLIPSRFNAECFNTESPRRTRQVTEEWRWRYECGLLCRGVQGRCA